MSIFDNLIRIDENGEFYGDCISVKIDDLKVIL